MDTLEPGRSNSLRRQSEGEVFNYTTLFPPVSSFCMPALAPMDLEDIDEVEEYIFDDCDFPFECLVFEGGGNKGLAYCGSLEVALLIPIFF